MIGPEGCPWVKSGLTEKRLTVRSWAGKEFLVKILALRALVP